MGQYEDQLKAMGTADAEWKITEFEALESQMTQLKLDMAAIASNPGWTGSSAEAASQMFTTLQENFAKNEAKLAEAKLALDNANAIRIEAAGKTDSLPDANVPDWVHAAALIGGSVLVPVPGVGTFAAETVVQKVNEFMGKQREAAAYQALETMESNLKAPKGQLKENKISTDDGITWPEPVPTPEWPGNGVVYDGDDTGAGGWKVGTGGGGGGGGSVTGVFDEDDPKVIGRPPRVIDNPPPYPPIVLPPEVPTGWPHNVINDPPTVSIDGDSGGGSNPGGLLGGGSGGLGLGLAGGGAAGLGAAKLASKGGLGGGGLFGPNGLLGGGAGGANGAGGGAGAKTGVVGGANAGAGSKGGNSAMMGGGQGGGSSDREKRASLGLMAPKLEDDEETGPRSSAAGAGGRD